MSHTARMRGVRRRPTALFSPGGVRIGAGAVALGSLDERVAAGVIDASAGAGSRDASVTARLNVLRPGGTQEFPRWLRPRQDLRRPSLPCCQSTVAYLVGTVIFTCFTLVRCSCPTTSPASTGRPPGPHLACMDTTRTIRKHGACACHPASTHDGARAQPIDR